MVDRSMKSDFPEPAVPNDCAGSGASFPHEEPARQKVVTNRLIRTLWGPSLSAALEAAHVFYAPEGDEPYLKDCEEAIATRFWQILTEGFPHCPPEDETACRALLWAVWCVLHEVRTAPMAPFVEDRLSVALRPVRRLQVGLMMGFVFVCI
jgi:hypothetical protein